MLCIRGEPLFYYRKNWNKCKVNYSSLLLSAPGVVTMILLGVMTSAPFAVAAPLNIVSTIFLKVSTIGAFRDVLGRALDLITLQRLGIICRDGDFSIVCLQIVQGGFKENIANNQFVIFGHIFECYSDNVRFIVGAK